MRRFKQLRDRLFVPTTSKYRGRIGKLLWKSGCKAQVWGPEAVVQMDLLGKNRKGRQNCALLELGIKNEKGIGKVKTANVIGKNIYCQCNIWYETKK